MPPTQQRLAFTLLVLFGINFMNFYDRQVLGAVAEPLRKALSLEDDDIGWLGTAFILLYAVVGLPFGRWADLGRRTWILAGGVTVWSLLTAASGLAWNFTSLFVARLGVGVGEASCAPAANSLLGDLFPSGTRARAISVFMLGLPLGLGASLIVSGYLAHHVDWRVAFFVAALPGLALGVLSLWIPEPARGAAERHNIGAARRQGSPLLLVLRIPTMWWIILSGALHNFNMYALGTFLSPYLTRWHGLDVARAGLISGVVYGIVGAVGILLGGWACDALVHRRISGRLEVSTLALALSAPCIFLALQQPAGAFWSFSAWMLPGCMLLYVYYSGVYATIQDIVEPSLRGTAMALYFCAMYLLGAALGPVATGWLSKHFTLRAMAAEGADVITDSARAVGLHDAMYIVPLLGVALAAVLAAGSRTVAKDHAELEHWLAAQAARAPEPA